MLPADDCLPVAVYEYGTVHKTHNHIKGRTIKHISAPVANGAHHRKGYQHQPVQSNPEERNSRIKGDPQRNQEVQQGKQQALTHEQLVLPVDSGQPGPHAILPARLPRSRVPAVKLLGVIPQSSRVLGGDERVLLVDNSAQALAMNLDGAVHVFHYGVGVPLQLGECGSPETGSAPWGDGDYIHVALARFVNRVRHPVGQRTIGSKPVVRGTLCPAAHRRHRQVAESLADYLKIVFTDLSVRIHQTDVLIARNQPELERAPPYAVCVTDVFLVTQDIDLQRAGAVARAIAGPVVNHINVGGRNTRPQNATQRLANSQALVLGGKQHTNAVHRPPLMTSSPASKESE